MYHKNNDLQEIVKKISYLFVQSGYYARVLVIM